MDPGRNRKRGDKPLTREGCKENPGKREARSVKLPGTKSDLTWGPIKNGGLEKRGSRRGVQGGVLNQRLIS